MTISFFQQFAQMSPFMCHVTHKKRGETFLILQTWLLLVSLHRVPASVPDASSCLTAVSPDRSVRDPVCCLTAVFQGSLVLNRFFFFYGNSEQGDKRGHGQLRVSEKNRKLVRMEDQHLVHRVG